METDKIALQRVCHPRLSSETEWTALGDVSLLDAPLRVPVILSRSLKPDQIAAAYQQLEAAVRRGAVVVGGFVSPAEKQVARQLARFPDLKLIRVVPFSLYNYPLTASVKARIQQGTT
ncbi:MAG: hypothetical protein IJV69_07105, partial [Kiritimatiellae bacterium]|nr:hypothetical protein [Kiritimatiellia bacterium]